MFAGLPQPCDGRGDSVVSAGVSSISASAHATSHSPPHTAAHGHWLVAAAAGRPLASPVDTPLGECSCKRPARALMAVTSLPRAQSAGPLGASFSSVSTGHCTGADGCVSPSLDVGAQWQACPIHLPTGLRSGHCGGHCDGHWTFFSAQQHVLVESSLPKNLQKVGRSENIQR